MCLAKNEKRWPRDISALFIRCCNNAANLPDAFKKLFKEGVKVNSLVLIPNELLVGSFL